MTFRQTCFLLLITAIYLAFELAFNARLLDVVGGGATENQIHSIEQYGRSLSGIALALFMLQGMLYFKNWGSQKKTDKKTIGFFLTFAFVSTLSFALPFFAALNHLPVIFGAAVGTVVLFVVLKFILHLSSDDCDGAMTYVMMILICGGFILSVYMSLQKLTNHLVYSSSPEFRHASSNIVLVQSALVDGKVRIDGLSDDPAIFSRPEGKAFLALFPLMAVSVERLDEKIRGVKIDLIRDEISNRAGGPEGLYKKYMEGVKEAATQYKKYDAGSRGANADENDIAHQQNKAWDEYKAKLYKHGWNPYTVPDKHRARVVRDVQSRVPVPDDWELTDEEGFRAAVERKMFNRRGTVRGNSVTHNGKTIPFGLSWPEFFAHPAVQEDIRKKMGLSSAPLLKPSYTSGPEFERTVFEPWLYKQAKKRLEVYDAPVSLFADKLTYAEEGKRMARAAIVPPIALFFSLLGAIAHLGKFAYLFLKVMLWKVLQKEKDNDKKKLGLALLFGVLSVVPVTGMTLKTLENEVTSSRIYGYLKNQVQEDRSTISDLIVNGSHIVAVGQGVFYSFDEKIRTDVLGGITFGYEPARLGKQTQGEK